jgi:hypothetical protein
MVHSGGALCDSAGALKAESQLGSDDSQDTLLDRTRDGGDSG